MDAKALAQCLEVNREIAEIWPVGNSMDIIRENNKPMYDRMGLMAEKIDALIKIENKTKQQQKQFTELLAAYKRLHELGITYAAAHARAETVPF